MKVPRLGFIIFNEVVLTHYCGTIIVHTVLHAIFIFSYLIVHKIGLFQYGKNLIFYKNIEVALKMVVKWTI